MCNQLDPGATCNLMTITEVGDLVGGIIKPRLKAEDRRKQAEALRREESSSSAAAQQLEQLEQERKQLLEESDKNIPLAVEQPSEALLKLLLLKKDGNYDYAYINTVGTLLAGVSSELLEVAQTKKNVSDATQKSIKEKISALLKEILTQC